MLEKAVTYLVEKQIGQGRIPESEKQVYQYGYLIMFEKLLNLLISLIIGIIIGRLLRVIVMLAVFVPLRKYAGGYHAKTAWQCIIITNMSILAVVSGAELLTGCMPIWSVVITDIIFVVIICMLAPIDTEAKPLEEEERRLCKKRTVVTGIAELLLGIALLSLGLTELTVTGTLSHLILVVALLVARWQNNTNGGKL